MEPKTVIQAVIGLAALVALTIGGISMLRKRG
jgi:hypothetical protein